MTQNWPIRDISTADLDAAVSAGIITPDQAKALLDFCADRAAKSGQADEENLRFISSFNDIFVAIGIALFIGALAYLTYDMAVVGRLAVAAAAWLLAEYFTRVRRLALPSIVLLLIFAVAVFWFVVAAMTGGDGVSLAGADQTAVIAAGLITTAAVFVHWLRFRVPITVAAGAGALVISIAATFGALGSDFFEQWGRVIFFCLGLLVFALAMAFDMGDRARLTRRTDVAFWLHLLAAPLIVHPVVWPLASSGEMTQAGAGAILAIFVGLSAIALVVDRRALLVSSLSYLIYASSQLLSLVQWETSASGVAVLLVGIAVLILSVAWRPLRGLLLGLLPSVITARVPTAS